jgi:ribosome-associated protein
MRENEGMSVAGVDLRVPPGPGLPQGLVIPADELVERFSRSQGPGGQGVNTTDSRVELLFDLAASTALTQTQRSRLRQALGARLVDGRVVVTASEHRSQLRNRAAARERLVALLREGLAPPPPPRRPTRPTRGSQRRRLETKRLRGEVKAGRGQVRREQ